VACTWDYGDWPTRKELYDGRSVLVNIQYKNVPPSPPPTHRVAHGNYIRSLSATAFCATRLTEIGKVRSKLHLKQK
jgi:hypothetical protein